MTQQEFDLLRIYDSLPTTLQDALAFVFRMTSAINSNPSQQTKEK